MKTKLFIAGSVLTLVLTAAPVFAESGKDHEGKRFGINLGSIISEFKKERNEDRKENRENRVKATSTVSVHGTVTAINSTIITVTDKDAAVHTVQAANASVQGGTLADIRAGDTVKVKGTVNGTVLVATKIVNKDAARRAAVTRLENLRAGIVTSVSGTGFTLTRFGTGTSATVSTNASTTVKVNGKASTTAAIQPGSAVIVVGESGTTTPDTLVGTVVHVINKGFGWLKHFLFR